MNSEFINKLLENGASKSMFDSFSKDIQLVVLAQVGNWIQISKMPLTYSQMERYQNDILWNVAIHYMENIPLEFIKIKKRSVSLYVVFNYFNLSEELVKRKFLRNATFHDRVEAVAIWYSSPNCRHLIEKKYDKNILFNIENYTSFTLARFWKSINVDELKLYSNWMNIPRIFFLPDPGLDISTGGWFGCHQCDDDNKSGCKHFPSLKFIEKHNHVCKCGKIHQ